MGSLVQTKTIAKLCNPILHFSDWKSMYTVSVLCSSGIDARGQVLVNVKEGQSLR